MVTFIFMLGMSWPEAPLVSTSSPRVKVITGEASVIPKPSRNLTFGAFLWNKLISAWPVGAAPTKIYKNIDSYNCQFEPFE